MADRQPGCTRFGAVVSVKGRSPMAEGVFRSLAKGNARIATVDSCGTGAYHTLDPPDSRTTLTLQKNGINDYQHGARQVTKEDFNNFDYIFAMDGWNLRDLQKMQRGIERRGQKSRAQVMLLGEYAGKASAEEVVDPYYGEDNGFNVVFEQVKRFSTNFLKSLEKDSGPNSS
ncbi:Low molecular weight phosphotyrosine protein phosphatase [Lithohypha guttulata]|uniref:Low molecular weight phosphotyrosine protein phosphatase n=1 Tax=Lithohypha guttulata TaxID=1690604 RepID=UPI002DE0273C|nr:Low molecular weight phosphotyrosine protein phosphatase [Lithohypha guttulata]